METTASNAEQEGPDPWMMKHSDADIILRDLAAASTFFRDMFAVAIAEHGEGRLPSIDVPEGGAWELYVVFAICWDTSAESAIRGLLRIAAEEMERVIPCWKTACFYDVEQAQSQIEYVLSKGLVDLQPEVLFDLFLQARHRRRYLFSRDLEHALYQWPLHRISADLLAQFPVRALADFVRAHSEHNSKIEPTSI